METLQIEEPLDPEHNMRNARPSRRRAGILAVIMCAAVVLTVVIVSSISSHTVEQKDSIHHFAVDSLPVGAGPAWQCEGGLGCGEGGAYAPFQCFDVEYGEKACGCVAPSGRWLFKPRTPSTMSISSCEALRRSCMMLSDKTFSSGPSMSCLAKKNMSRGMPGGFSPNCEPDGSYSALQYHGSTGYSWCSSPTGEVIEGTKRSPTDQQLMESECNFIIDECSFTKKCEQQVSRVRSGWTPQCSKNGNHKATQCLSDSCWCVDEDGVEITGTRNHHDAFHHRNGKINCENERNYESPRTPCEVEVKQARLNNASGYIPMCNEDGDYLPKQCNADGCWCVKGHGEKINLKLTRYLTSEDCEYYQSPGRTDQLGPCEDARRVSRLDLDPWFNRWSDSYKHVILPLCDQNGYFLPRQCNVHKECFCVDDAGIELFGTRGRPGPRSHKECAALRARIADKGAGETYQVEVKPCSTNLGKSERALWDPTCDEFGQFTSLQCSRQGCWCSNRIGQPYPATFHRSTLRNEDAEVVCERLRNAWPQ